MPCCRRGSERALFRAFFYTCARYNIIMYALFLTSSKVALFGRFRNLYSRPFSLFWHSCSGEILNPCSIALEPMFDLPRTLVRLHLNLGTTNVAFRYAKMEIVFRQKSSISSIEILLLSKVFRICLLRRF